MPARIGLLALVALLAALLRMPSAAPALDGRSALARAEARPQQSAVTTARGSHPSERGASASDPNDACVPPPPPPRVPLGRALGAPSRAHEAPAPLAIDLGDRRRLIRAARPRSHVPRMGDEPPRA
ncbi:MAG: hypothetical protein IT373_10390 [Polyangiaceae bacterium]|nr:hypothetical protein [Polyangiaceae bacterium]